MRYRQHPNSHAVALFEDDQNNCARAIFDALLLAGIRLARPEIRITDDKTRPGRR